MRRKKEKQYREKLLQGADMTLANQLLRRKEADPRHHLRRVCFLSPYLLLTGTEKSDLWVKGFWKIVYKVFWTKRAWSRIQLCSSLVIIKSVAA